jgi:hypothetical protein
MTTQPTATVVTSALIPFANIPFARENEAGPSLTVTRLQDHAQTRQLLEICWN